ncbi:MAG: glycosyltransferase family 4 protein [Aggregatilineales bacterium]
MSVEEREYPISRILMLTGQYPPNRGGIGDYTRCLVNALVEAGVDISLAVPQNSDLSGTKAPLAKNISRWAWSLLPEIKRLLVETDSSWLHIQYQTNIYKCHPAVSLLPAFLRQTGWRGQVAVTFHDLQKPYLFPSAGKLRTKALEFMCRSAKVCIAADSLDVQILRNMQAQVWHIPIGSNISKYYEMPSGTAQEFRRLYDIPENAVLIGHFGTASGLETLVSALTQIPRAYLLLIGKREPKGVDDLIPINEAVPETVRQQIVALNMHTRTRWTGYLPPADVAIALKTANVVVLPYLSGASVRHGGLLAAMTQGAAIVTTFPHYPMPYLIDETHLLTVPPGDPKSIVEAILRIVCNDDLRNKLSINAGQIAETVFSWSAIAQSHVELYQQ